MSYFDKNQEQEISKRLSDTLYKSLSRKEKPNVSLGGCFWGLFVFLFSLPVGMFNIWGLAWASLEIWNMALTQYDAHKPTTLALIGLFYVISLFRLPLIMAQGVKSGSGFKLSNLIIRTIFWWVLIGLSLLMVYLFSMFV